jgi:hypothetical protein
MYTIENQKKYLLFLYKAPFSLPKNKVFTFFLKQKKKIKGCSSEDLFSDIQRQSTYISTRNTTKEIIF